MTKTDFDIAERRARSARNVGLLLMIWGIAMLLLELVVLGDGLPVTLRFSRDPLFLLGCTTLIVVGAGVCITIQMALSGNGRGSRTIALLAPVGGIYGLIASAAFVVTTARTSTMTHTIAATVTAVATLGIWYIALMHATRVIRALVSALQERD